MSLKKQGYQRSKHMQDLKKQTKAIDEKEVIDTSEIKEAGEDWFKDAKLKLPDEKEVKAEEVDKEAKSLAPTEKTEPSG